MSSVSRFAGGDFLAFVEKFMLRNEPCVFTEQFTRDWKSRKLWQKDGRPDLAFLAREFGNAIVPVADCTTRQLSSHSKSEMKFSNYIEYWRSCSTSGPTDAEGFPPPEHKLLYTKDWHFVRDFPDYGAYVVPDFFCSDWVNEVWDLRKDVEDDYRFVYMGPKGTWTPFHADVFRSYSWSANVCGRKEWLLYPPGEEELLRDTLGNLPFDVCGPEMEDRRRFPRVGEACKPIRVVQEAGEVIFVPSGWHHQVRNLEDTISINHNWTNAFSVERMWSHLKAELSLVKAEIDDCKEMEGWEEQCQVILKASAGMDYKEFLQFLCLVALPRLQEFEKLTESAPVQETGVDMYFSDFRRYIYSILPNKSFTFFGLEMAGSLEDEGCKIPGGITSELHLTARDDMASVLKCLPSGSGHEEALSALPHKAPFHCLFQALPVRLKRMVASQLGPDNAFRSAYATFRAFELHKIQTVVHELTGSVDFIAVVPNIKSDCL